MVMTSWRESRRKAADNCREVFLPTVSVVERQPGEGFQSSLYSPSLSCPFRKILRVSARQA